MGKAKPFIDKKKAHHFHLVHRSQHDPLIADENSSAMVLNPVSAPPIEYDSDSDIEVNDAEKYGIYYNDGYNYMQHLRSVGETPGAILMDAPAQKKEKAVSFFLPDEVLPSTDQDAVGLPNKAAFMQSPLDVDLDPAVREALNALEDDAYVDDNLNDDFFDALDADEYEDDEDLNEYKDSEYFNTMKQYKTQSFDSDDCFSDDEEERKDLRSMISMSSAVLPRTKGKEFLDNKFEHVLRDYEEELEDEEGLEEESKYEHIFDEFLEKYEVIGKKMVDKASAPVDAVSELRQMLLETNLGSESSSKWVKLLQAKLRGEDIEIEESDEEVEDQIMEREEPKKAEWDCETIVSTYSNLENHPQIISERKPRIQLDKRGFARTMYDIPEEQDDEEEETEEKINLGVARPKNESLESKKERKLALKEQKRNRRIEKKALKVAFKNEVTKQSARENVTTMSV
jgi:protein LTV1